MNKKTKKHIKKTIERYAVEKSKFTALSKQLETTLQRLKKLEEYCKEIENSAKKKPAPAAPAKGKTEKKKNKNKKPVSAKKKPAPKPKSQKTQTKKVAVSKKPDDLKQIKGIGPVIEAKLKRSGVTRFADLAAWKKNDIDKFSSQLKIKGRIERERWVAQAIKLAKK